MQSFVISEINLIADKILARNNIWIVGDEFVESSIEENFMRIPEDDSFTRQNFDIKYVATSAMKSNHASALGRIRNNVAFTIKQFVNLPKILVLILEDDTIKKIFRQKDLKYIYERQMKWLVNEVRKLIMTQNDYLPKKSQIDTQVLWIEPTMHVNYRNTRKRELLINAMQEEINLHKHNCLLKLKQVWDEQDNSLFLAEQQRLTAPGKFRYWKAVDKTIRFCDAVINANASKNDERFFTYNYGNKKEDESDPVSLLQEHQSEGIHHPSQFHWRADQAQQTSFRGPRRPFRRPYRRGYYTARQNFYQDYNYQ